jgi:glutaconate CoA-transferase subunit A
MTDAIVKVPYGAHPTACFGHYDYDADFLKIYHKAALSDSTFKDFLEEYVFLKNHNAYLEKIGYKI